LGLSGCNSQKAVTVADAGDIKAAASVQGKPASASASTAESIEGVLGSYVGNFGDNKITLLVTKATAGSISGRSIVGGNDRPFDGTLSLEGGSYNIVASEPGDHRDDGFFTFTIAETALDELKGTWKAKDVKRPEKSYTLTRQKFEYRTDVGNWPEASQRLLKAEDVENLGKGQLESMRNEIFARHGYCFGRKELRQQFEIEDWYVPNTVDVKGYLTDVEKKNIAIIKRYEKYADEYGDEYGR